MSFIHTYIFYSDPSLKRTLCRRCDTLMLPGISSRIFFEGNVDGC
jgi:RNase P subunit RPR2